MSDDLIWFTRATTNEDMLNFYKQAREQVLSGYRTRRCEVYTPKTYDLIYGEGGLFERLAGKKISEMIDERKK